MLEAGSGDLHSCGSSEPPDVPGDSLAELRVDPFLKGMQATIAFCCVDKTLVGLKTGVERAAAVKNRGCLTCNGEESENLGVLHSGCCLSC